MTRRRFYASPNSFDHNHQFVTLSTEEARHLRDVLRLSREDRAFVFDGQGHEYECLVSDVGRDFARLSIISEVSPTRSESPLSLTLAVALLKGEKFDLVVQKTTELGVRTIAPVITKLADVRLRDQADAERRLARWQRIALEAAKQSGRALIPRITPPSELAAWLQTLQKQNETCLMFSERLGTPLAETLSEVTQTAHITALVGSEGGWTDEEISLVRTLDWKVVTLGGRTLRAETAAITVCALLQHRAGDLY